MNTDWSPTSPYYRSHLRSSAKKLIGQGHRLDLVGWNDLFSGALFGGESIVVYHGIA